MLDVLVVTVLTSVLVQEPQAGTAGDARDRKTWTGCVQVASTPSAFRLNLDDRVPGARPPAQPPGLGEPFFQLVPSREGQSFQSFVGKRVRVTGRRVSDEEAQQLAAERPDQQEANAAAAGTGGPPQRHLAYVRVEKITDLGERCQ